MSKSKPDTAIFMTDTNEDVERKFKKAYSIDGVVEDNPILEYFKYIVFEKFDEVEIERPEKFGGLYKANSYEELEKDFKNQEIKSIDLKSMCAKYINKLLEPIRKHFESGEPKKLLEKVKSFNVVR
jgi:tyrosyl-tRNA synthetase